VDDRKDDDVLFIHSSSPLVSPPSRQASSCPLSRPTRHVVRRQHCFHKCASPGSDPAVPGPVHLCARTILELGSPKLKAMFDDQSTQHPMTQDMMPVYFLDNIIKGFPFADVCYVIKVLSRVCGWWLVRH